jgi:hypothetical protein
MIIPKVGSMRRCCKRRGMRKYQQGKENKCEGKKRLRSNRGKKKGGSSRWKNI